MLVRAAARVRPSVSAQPGRTCGVLVRSATVVHTRARGRREDRMRTGDAVGCNFWRQLQPAGADMFDLSAWEPVFALEGPEVTVVCAGAGFTL